MNIDGIDAGFTHMIFDVVLRDTAIDNFSLCDCHSVVVHLFQRELFVGKEGLAGFPEH